MRIHLTSNPKLSRVVYSALLSVAGAIIGLLALGTIFALLRPSNSKPLFSLGKASETGQASGSGTARNDDVRVFSGLGRLRIPLSNSSTLVLSIAFPYSASDTAFTEELAGKIGEFRLIASDYFSSLPAEKLVELDEETAKQEILGRINAGLRLGRIEALYFSDLLIIEGAL